MSVTFNTFDPNVYAQQYAAQNNMSLADAKAELKAKHGDPQAPTGESVFANMQSYSVDENDFNLDDFEFTADGPSAKTKEADDEVLRYAAEHNCSRAEAREALKNKFGNPEGYDNTDTTTSSSKKSSSGNQASDKTKEADDEVLRYAAEHNCSRAEAREALKNIFGNPSGYDNA